MPEQRSRGESRPQSIDAIGGELRAAMSGADARSKRRRTRRIGLGFAGATAVVCALAFLSPFGGDNEKLFTVDQAVAEVAQAAFDTPRKHSNEYLHTRSSSTFFAGYSVVAGREYKWLLRRVMTRETWSRSGHTSWTRSTSTRGEYPTEEDRETAEAAERATLRLWNRDNPGRKPTKSLLSSMRAEDVEGGEVVCRLSPDNAWLARDTEFRALPGIKVRELPETPKAMYRFLFANTESSVRKSRREDWVWQMIGDALSSGSNSLTPAQRSAMIGALAEISNVKTFGATDDPTGRPAIGFSHTGLGKVRRLYFDRETGLTSYSDTVSSNGRPVSGVGNWRLENFEYVKKPPRLTPTRGRSLRVLLACPYVGPKGHYLRAPR